MALMQTPASARVLSLRFLLVVIGGRAYTLPRSARARGQANNPDPQAANPTRWGYSLANVGELLTASLDAVRAVRCLLEIGAYLRRAHACCSSGPTLRASIAAVDPLPPDELPQPGRSPPGARPARGDEPRDPRRIDAPRRCRPRRRPQLLHALGGAAPDRRALRGGALPLLLFHDVGWPHARRDTYYAPDRIPEDKRQPLARNTGLAPGNTGVDPAGLPFEWAADHEGGPRNGVLTAIEDFMDRGEGLQLGSCPGVLRLRRPLARDAPYGRGVAESRAVRRQPGARAARGQPGRPPDRGAFVENRERELTDLRARVARQEELLRSMRASRAFGIAERLSKIRRRGATRPFSREGVGRALGARRLRASVASSSPRPKRRLEPAQRLGDPPAHAFLRHPQLLADGPELGAASITSVADASIRAADASASARRARCFRRRPRRRRGACGPPTSRRACMWALIQDS